MTARNDSIQNFCDKIKGYHKKKEEEQFYDFTIKDKDGEEIKSHKFLLVSQSDYFAGLFRTNPTASETTFPDFSLDVISKCIDYLYTHEINLIDCNVQNLLMFADFINLTDVSDICIDFINKNIDKSNYCYVINFGDAHGMEELVKAGVLFAVRNFRQCFDDLDEATKEMITRMIATLANRQKQQVTIMTGDQWNINLLGNSLSLEEKVFHACCSSVHETASFRGPSLAINGKLAAGSTHFFYSELENHPWLEVKLPSPVLISSVTVVHRQDCCQERLRNLEVRAGMEPAPEGFTMNDRGQNGNKKLEVNSRCGYFAGPAEWFIPEGHVITFDKPTLAQYITLQILGTEYLQVNGIKINNGSRLEGKGGGRGGGGDCAYLWKNPGYALDNLIICLSFLFLK